MTLEREGVGVMTEITLEREGIVTEVTQEGEGVGVMRKVQGLELEGKIKTEILEKLEVANLMS